MVIKTDNEFHFNSRDSMKYRAPQNANVGFGCEMHINTSGIVDFHAVDDEYCSVDL